MNRRRLTMEEKTKILLNFSRCSYGKLSEILGVPRSSISSFIYRTIKTGTILNKKSCGRPLSINNRMKRKILTFVRNYPDTTMNGIKSKLNIHCSTQTIRKTLKALKINYYNKTKKIKLNGKDKLMRIEFANTNKNKDFRNLIFTDTTSVEDYFYYKKRNWRIRGVLNPEKHYDRRPKTFIKKYTKYFCWIAFDGKRNITETKKWNASELIKILEESFKDTNISGKFIIMDQDSVNKTDIVNTWIMNKGGVRLLLPVRSADFNPIENFFFILKKKISTMNVDKTREANIIKAKKAFFEVDDFILNCLCESFSRRLQKAINLKGANTKY